LHKAACFVIPALVIISSYMTFILMDEWGVDAVARGLCGLVPVATELQVALLAHLLERAFLRFNGSVRRRAPVEGVQLVNLWSGLVECHQRLMALVDEVSTVYGAFVLVDVSAVRFDVVVSLFRWVRCPSTRVLARPALGFLRLLVVCWWCNRLRRAVSPGGELSSPPKRIYASNGATAASAFAAETAAGKSLTNLKYSPKIVVQNGDLHMV